MRSLRQVAAAAAAAVLGAHGVAAVFTNGSVVAPCDSPIYCHGEMLQQIQLARPFADSKTFVDRPATKPVAEIQAAFAKLARPLKNDSALHDFLDQHFGPAGAELTAVPRDQLATEPAFLDAVADPVVREFVQKVMDIWPDLTRAYSPAALQCSAGGPGEASACPGSFIALNRTFVVAGGRFREPYYWDSYWILEGLLRTRGSFTGIARNIIENFLDLVERFGIVPNGARVYYLNRSQPPMLAQMVRLYVEHTGDAAVLDRALPLLEREYDFWAANRSVDVAGPAGETWTLARYAVANTEPRPESFREDFDMAANGTADPAALYADLASAAESGWDFSSRWLARPQDAVVADAGAGAGRDPPLPLRSLRTRDVLPVCLNSILYANERAMAGFLRGRGDAPAADRWDERAARRSRAMEALMWNQTLFSYCDYNLTSRAHEAFAPADADAGADAAGAPPGMQVRFHAAQLFPFWVGATPDALKAPAAVKRAYARVARYLDERAGGIPATNLRTLQQWDQPNVWPPLMHQLMQGLLNAAGRGRGRGPTSPGPTAAPDDQRDRADIRALAVHLAQRYVDSAFCAWYATGGSTALTPKLPGLTDADHGVMFEKYADNSTNVAGGGGEYEVVEGFGWTNGVLIWAANTFSADLKRPDCGDIKAAVPKPAAAAAASNARRSALHLDRWDAAHVKRFAVGAP